VTGATCGAAPTGGQRFLRGCRRGLVRQELRRQQEHAARSGAVTFANSAATDGLSLAQAAAALAVSPRTLRQWRQDVREDRSRPRLRGRRAARSSRETRQGVWQWLRTEGAHSTLAALRHAFPAIGRAELARILARYRRVYNARWRNRGWRLTWFGSGRVWTMDFVERDVDLEFPAILAIRDLASGYQLAWLGVKGLTAEAVIEVVSGLFERHGAPLVLKSDNGSAFIAEQLGASLASWEVIQLFSPPRTPNYNGAGERSHRTLKLHTEAAAQQQGRPGDWSEDDLEQALDRNNQFDRPWGAAAPTSGDVWTKRNLITPQERAAFRSTVALNRKAEREQRGVADDQALEHHARAKIDRQAVPEALVAHRYLTLEPAKGHRREPSSGDGLRLKKSAHDDQLAPTSSEPSAHSVTPTPGPQHVTAPFAPTPRPDPQCSEAPLELVKICDEHAHAPAASCRI
jgi:hypothetical protein